jgi:CRP-like cAMP-binding protein/tRNA A-37 threonylcarbamoyl transferase component Bud32
MSSRPPAPETAAAGTASESLPQRIGKYPVKAKIGEGATSEVFLAHDPFRGHDVAIKRVRRSALVDAREAHFQKRFFAAEAALVGQLHHPNVVQIMDAVSEGEELPYLVMEYVPGVTLRRFCRADGLLPLAQVIEIGFKCAMALNYCWRQGLIHRDVKPANVLAVLDGDQIVDLKISDFGSVFNSGADITQVHRVGSLAYMSPEQLDGDTVDCRADIYSLCAVLYHLIAGRPPFDATEQRAIMYQIFNATPPRLMALREGLPAPLAELIERGLAKDRESRPANWDEFAQALSEMASARIVPRGALQAVLDSERFTLLRAQEFFARFGDVELWEVVHRAKWERHTFGQALYRKGESGNSFHIITQGEVEVFREGRLVAKLGAGTSVGEMAYLAPSPELRVHGADVLVAQPTTTVSFTPDTLAQLSLTTMSAFDKAFIGVLVRRLHAAHESLAHPRRIM